jgi:hypothetical protein
MNWPCCREGVSEVEAVVERLVKSKLFSSADVVPLSEKRIALTDSDFAPSKILYSQPGRVSDLLLAKR